MEFTKSTRVVPERIAMYSRGQPRRAWAFFGDLSDMGRWLPRRAHPRRTLVLSMRPAACWKRGIGSVGQSEGELCKRQKETGDQQQSTELAPRTSSVHVYAGSQRVHAFVEATLFQPANMAKPLPGKRTSSRYQTHA
jgi:hypothetical protein